MNHPQENQASSRQLAVGDVLFSEGDRADCAYIIEDGTLEISTVSEGQRVVITELGAGEIVGEMGVIDSAPRTATATAISATRLMVVTRNQLTERIAQADPILKLLVKILLDRYRSGLNTVKGDASLASPQDELISEDVVGEYVRHGIDKIRLEAELKDALAQGQLQVNYQPLLDCATRKVAGFEALTRWHHPARGAISPGLFITLAEETSLIVPVGLYVFETACAQLQQFQQREGYGPGSLFMSINVSARQIADPDFIVQAASRADRFGLNRADIKLEITESLAVDMQATDVWIDRAHELGFQVSLDDFGTGYSSLATLYQLDVDYAKIDQAFVRPLETEPRAKELLRGIVALMRALRLKVVVEGIEEAAELDYISELGCHLAQGFLIGKSLPADDAAALLDDPSRLDSLKI
ncbi:MAG: EAL domain-containing protein [Pseudomonadota bacterium]